MCGLESEPPTLLDIGSDIVTDMKYLVRPACSCFRKSEKQAAFGLGALHGCRAEDDVAFENAGPRRDLPYQRLIIKRIADDGDFRTGRPGSLHQINSSGPCPE